MKKTYSDPSQNFFQQFPHPLDPLFKPKSVALIGAKDDKGTVGHTILQNLKTFSGKLYPINPKRTTVLGKKCYPNLSAVPEPVDLAIIVTPAKTVPSLIKECVDKKIPSVIIISAGFKELGPSGIALEEEIRKTIQNTSTRVIGPNCLGLMNPSHHLNATFAATDALKGEIAFISQSGAMCTAVLDWSLEQKVGFSAFVSIGSMLDIHWGDLIDYLGNDPNTSSILIYMETIGNARAFLSSARKVTLTKPIIVIKAGKTEAAAKAAASHTGSLAGSDDVFEVAMQRAGVLRVDSIDELFNIALALGKQPVPKGSNLTIITNAGGPSVLAVDKAVSEGAKMSELDPKTIQSLNKFLPEAWSHSNPVDILGDASPERYAQTINEIVNDPGTDGILVVLSPQDMTDPKKTAENLLPFAEISKPIFASWMGGTTVQEGTQILNSANIPTFAYPDSASKVFADMCRHHENLQMLYQIPAIRDELDNKESGLKHLKVQEMLVAIRSQNRDLLTEMEAKKVLSYYGIPTVDTFIATTSDEAVKYAKKLGFPVVLKLHSETITHKTDVGGVKLNLKTDESVRESFEAIEESVTRIAGKEHFQGVSVQKMIPQEGYELILGSTTDAQFGPVLLFGAGGALVEVFQDRALALPPLNATLAKHLIDKTKISKALKGFRGEKPIDFAELERILISFAQLIVENSWIKECDINPLRVSSNGMIALDARIVLHAQTMKDADIPKVAIRPYPNEHILQAVLKDKKEVTLRPIRPEDEPMLEKFHKSLSENTVYSRYRQFLSLDKRIAHKRLSAICCIDYDRDIRIIAEYKNPKTKENEIVGIARLLRYPGTNKGQFQIIVVDSFHRTGIGTLMMKQLLSVGKKEGLQTVHSDILNENEGMLHICKKLGFELKPHPIEKNLLIADKTL